MDFARTPVAISEYEESEAMLAATAVEKVQPRIEGEVLPMTGVEKWRIGNRKARRNVGKSDSGFIQPVKVDMACAV